MTPEQLMRIKTEIIIMAAYFGIELRNEVIAAYAEDLADQDASAVIQAITKIRRDPKMNKHNILPIPAKVLGLLQPQVTDVDHAREIAGQIVIAIRRYGYINGLEAKIYLGSYGWEVVVRMGGWQALCEAEVDGNFHARLRDIALTVQHRADAGVLNQIPQLPEPKRNSLETSIGWGQLPPANSPAMQEHKKRLLEIVKSSNPNRDDAS